MNQFDTSWENQLTVEALEILGAYVDEVIPLQAATASDWELPSEWKLLASKTKAEAIEALWGGEDAHFRQFLDYLKENLLTLAFGRGRFGNCLIYIVSNFEEVAPNHYINGAFFGGCPLSDEKIIHFEEAIGRLPSSLRFLWKTHNYMYLRNGSRIDSIDIGSVSSHFPPASLGIFEGKTEGDCSIECLSIANCGSAAPYCFIREPGSLIWSETIVQVNAIERVWWKDTDTTLDELISRQW